MSGCATRPGRGPAEDRTEIAARRCSLRDVAEKFQAYQQAVREADDLRGLITSGDAEMATWRGGNFRVSKRGAKARSEEIKGDLVTSEDRAIDAVILEVRAGVGGDEAGIWAGDILNMYQRFAADVAGGGRSSTTARRRWAGASRRRSGVHGEGVWQRLGYEGGTHCGVKRVPATEPQGRVHTSTATVAVLPEPENADVKVNGADGRWGPDHRAGPGRPERQQGRHRGAHAAQAHRHRGAHAGDQEPAAEQGAGVANPQGPPPGSPAEAARGPAAGKRTAMIGSGDRAEHAPPDLPLEGEHRGGPPDQPVVQPG